jgi:hypothetical protein
MSRRPLIDRLEDRRLMATFAVTSAADSGAGSLRDAIAQANATTSADVINFAIGSGGVTINLQSPLNITRPVTIDATTQPGYSTSPVVRLNDASTTASALLVGANATGTVIRGLSITGFGNPSSASDGNAIVLAATSTVENCYIGIAPNNGSSPNEGDGIVVNSTAPSTLIQNNVISSNGGDGVEVYADYTRFVGNTIGLDPSGSFARGNAGHGINGQAGFDLQVWGNLGMNVISANGGAGLFLNAAAGARVFGNYFGLSKSGNAMLANGTYGIVMDGSAFNLIGNTATNGNRFGGNGIRSLNAGNGSTIRFNTFGFGINPNLDVGGEFAMNLETGGHEVEDNAIGRVDRAIRLAGSQSFVQRNLIGITTDGAAVPVQIGISIAGNWNDTQYNTITNCAQYGVWVVSGNNNIVRNTIWNAGQAVWISNGANSNMPVPTVLSAIEQPDGSVNVNVTTNFNFSETIRYFFYSSDTAGHPSSGDSQRWIDVESKFVVAGNQTFTFNLAPGKLLDGQHVSVSLIRMVNLSVNDSGNGETSQTSPGFKVVASPAVYGMTFDRFAGNAIDVRFSSDVGASLNASDITFTRAVDGATFNATSVTWNAATKTARFVRTGGFPDGRYTASIKTASVFANGKWNQQNFPTEFRMLRGDANDDGTVNFNDLLILAQNYGSTGRNFAQGNFNYSTDGKVDFSDLLLLAQNYNRTIALAQPAAAAPLKARVADGIFA